jgi:hypothetical protein
MRLRREETEQAVMGRATARSRRAARRRVRNFFMVELPFMGVDQ